MVWRCFFLEIISQKIKSASLKVTPQRIAIYKALYETKSHPTAEMLYNSLKELYPTMSFATVYKTLTVFKKAKLIQELNLNDSSFHYDINTDFHSHLVCTCCKSVFDYNLNVSFDVCEKIKDETGFIVENKQLYFYGKCRKCQEY